MEVEISSLTKIGLTEKEARTYFANLELGPSSLTEIAKKAGLKRPTTYLTLDELLKAGLIIKTPKHRGNLFTAENPKKLLALMRNREQEFAQLVPLFLARQKSGNKPSVSFFDGKTEVERIYREEIFTEPNIVFYGTNLERLDSNFPELLPFAHALWKKNKTKVWDLLTNSPFARQYQKQESTKLHQIRIAPEGAVFHEDNAITKSSIYIISLAEPLLVKIENKNIAETYRSLFYLAWNAAESSVTSVMK